jgi:hypothetical protein
LLLGFYKGSAVSAEVREAVAQRILRQRLATVARPLLPDADLRCTEPGCLLRLYNEQGSPQYLMGGSIEEGSVQAWILATSSRTQKWVSGVPELEELACRDCSEEERIEKLEHVAVRLIERVTASPPAPSATPCQPARTISFARAFAIGASAGFLFSGLLAGSVTAATAAGQRDVLIGPPVVSPDIEPIAAGAGWGPYSAIGFSTAVAALGGGLVAALPLLTRSREGRSEGTLCAPAPLSAQRWSTSRGAVLGTVVSLALSSLASAIGFTAGSPSACLAGEPMVACSFPVQARVSWGFTGAWVAGIAVTLLWPSSTKNL